MTDEEIHSLMASATGPNEPQALPGSGLTGPREKISPELARERRKAMLGAVLYSAGNDAIMEAFTQYPWNMTEEAIRRLKAEVHKMIRDEDVEHAEVSRSTARRRILGHIAEAKSQKKWAAVANFELALMKIEGTEAPEPNAGTGDESRLTEAIMAQLQVKDQGQLRIMVERQRIYIDTGTVPPEPRNRPKSILSEDSTG